jgi:hypothetical protein
MKKSETQELANKFNKLSMDASENAKKYAEAAEKLKKIGEKEENEEAKTSNTTETDDDEMAGILELDKAEQEKRLKEEINQIQYNKELLALESERIKLEQLKKVKINTKGINPTQKTFSGRAIDGETEVVDWLYTLNLNLDLANIEDEQKALVAASYLKGNASQVYRQATETHGISWQEFQQLMLKHFLKRDNDIELVKKIWELKQDYSISKYIEKFRLLINQTKDIAENIKIFMFKSGIHKNVEAEITYRNPKTLEDAIMIAEDMERSYGYELKTHILNYARHDSSNRFNRINQYNNRGYSHENPVIICFYCGKMGHISIECFKKKRDLGHNITIRTHNPRYNNPNYSNQNPNSNFNNPSNTYNNPGQPYGNTRFYNQNQNANNRYNAPNLSNITCYNCNNKGHYATSCPNPKKQYTNNPNTFSNQNQSQNQQYNSNNYRNRQQNSNPNPNPNESNQINQ